MKFKVYGSKENADRHTFSTVDIRKCRSFAVRGEDTDLNTVEARKAVQRNKGNFLS